MEDRNEKKLIPTHMQYVPSQVSMDVFSDSSESEYDIKSASSGIEMDMYSPASSEMGFRNYQREGPLSVEGDADYDNSALCAVNLKDYISDLTLLSHAAVLGDEAGGGSKTNASEQQPERKRTESMTEIACTSTYEKWKRLSGPMALCVIIGLIVILWGRGHILQLLQWLEHLPLHQSLLMFVCLFTFVSLPFGFGYIILNMMAGYLYGIIHGQLIVMVSVAMGISVSFLLCRKWLNGYARSIVNTNTSLQAVLKVVEGPQGFKVIFLTRFTPVPFGLQNVLFAMTGVSYWKFVLASVFGLLPTQILNTYMGSTVRSMQEVLTDRVDGYIILGIQVIFSIFLMLYLLSKARRELAKLTHKVDVESGGGGGGGGDDGVEPEIR